MNRRSASGVAVVAMTLLINCSAGSAGGGAQGAQRETGGRAGQLDPGGSAGSLELGVTPNPSSVLSAVATVRWSHPFLSVVVRVRSGKSPDEVTPTASLSNLPSPLVIPIVPLEARTPYLLVATATDETGAEEQSNIVAFTTGELPTGLPDFTVAAGGAPSPGYTLVARFGSEQGTSDYVTIVDATGAPVWYFRPGSSDLIGDFQQQPDGSFTLALNTATGAYFYQQIDVMGTPIRSWTAIDDPNAHGPSVGLTGTDNHELRLQPNGDALLFGNIVQAMDMTAYGGQSNAEVAADVLERVTANGDVTFWWNAFQHVDPGDADRVATSLTTTEVDLTHANSIDVMQDGSYLISLRNFSQVLDIDSTTGVVRWRLGGAKSDFRFVNDPLAGFSCQHGARQLQNGHILLFDDGNGHSPPQSRAVEYELDTKSLPMTATLVWSAEDDPPLYTRATGYAQRLSNGNTLIAYGMTLRAQEVDAAGQILWDLSEPDGGTAFYRAYRLDELSPQALLTPKTEPSRF